MRSQQIKLYGQMISTPFDQPFSDFGVRASDSRAAGFFLTPTGWSVEQLSPAHPPARTGATTRCICADGWPCTSEVFHAIAASHHRMGKEWVDAGTQRDLPCNRGVAPPDGRISAPLRPPGQSLKQKLTAGEGLESASPDTSSNSTAAPAADSQRVRRPKPH